MPDNNPSSSFLIDKVVEAFQSLPYFNKPDDSEDVLFPLNIDMSDKDCRLIVVAGANASGKSVVGSLVESVAKKNGFVARNCCMRNRTYSGFGAKLIFGDESTQSTGVCTITAVRAGLTSSADAESPSVMILDEPDLGLSQESAMGMGAYIASFVNDASTNLKMTVVISHSRDLYKVLIEKMGCKAHKIFVGNDHKTFDDWMDAKVEPLSISELLDLRDIGHSRRVQFEKISERRKKS